MNPKSQAWQLYADAVQASASASAQLSEQRKALRECFARLARMDVEEPILAEPKTNQNMKTYDYATDAEMGEIEAGTVQAAYAKLRRKLTADMIEDGATLWVENADPDSGEPRLTLGKNAE